MASSSSDFQCTPSALAGGIDPRYMYLKYKQSNAMGMPSFKTAESGFIPVIGKVKIVVDLPKDGQADGLALWKGLSEVQHGVEVKYKTSFWIVTGRIPFDRFEDVQSQVFVISLRVAQAVKPQLRETVADIGLSSPHGSLSQEVLDQGGEGVVVGIVDYGCDFNHTHFIDPDGRTRIQSIWAQGLGTNPDSPQGYGKVFTADKINAALQQSNPYIALGYDVPRGEHGTHVMDIAAGSDKDRPGVAPKARIIFVELSTKEDRTVEGVLKLDFGDSVRVIEAVRYIFDQAGTTPCVVNLSLGTNGGPHDGTNPVELAFEGFVKEQPNRAIVVAAANSHADKIHQSGRLRTGESVELQWKIAPRDPTANEIEIWYSGTDEFDFEFFNPNGARIAHIPLGQEGGVWNRDDKLVAYIIHTKGDVDNHDNVIHIFQDPTQYRAAGVWGIKLTAKTVSPGPKGGEFHAWIERDDYGRSQFNNDDPRFTLGSISTGKNTITVGSYDAHRPSKPISYFSGAGPTRDGRQKPEVSAPGHDVWAADSTTKTGLTKMSGTSMAAPAVTGLVARILGHAHSQGVKLDIKAIRAALIETSRKDPPASTPDLQYGKGRVSAEAIIKATSLPRPASSSS